MRPFGFWCQKVLPLVYDQSLSYYEVLCKVRDYINNLIKQDVAFGEELLSMQDEINVLNKWVANFDSSYIKTLIEQYITTAIFLEITDTGYIVYNIPTSWDAIKFNTTGVDIELENEPEYGHLILSY